MDRKKHFEKYYSRFMWESIIRSTMYGLSVGLTLGFISAFVTWFTEFNGFWMTIAIIAGGALIASPIFYFTLFRPSVTSNARRIDRYGLDERLITMLEYEGDTSYIAELQRQDAAEKLATIQPSHIKIVITTLSIVFLSVSFFFGAGMTTVNGLSTIGVLPGGLDFIDSITPDPDPVYIEVNYMVYEGGIIDGDEMQIIEAGGATTPVVAIPDDGYAFDSWDDGGKKPTRSDSKVTESITFTAIFLPLGDSGEGEGEGQPGDGDMPGEGEQPGKYSGQGDGGNNPNGPPSMGAGGEYLESNQIIDGETYYGSLYDQYYDDALADLTENAEMPNGLKDFINSYYEIIHATDPDAEEGSE